MKLHPLQFHPAELYTVKLRELHMSMVPTYTNPTGHLGVY
jgi:hypothetical protein